MITEYSDLRTELVELLRRDLFGPAGGQHEEVDEPRLSDRYLVGALAPRRRPPDDPAEEDDGAEGDENDSGEDGTPEDARVISKSILPSSMGMSCSIDGDVKTFVIDVSWGEYARGHSSHLLNDNGNPKTVWLRTPKQFSSQPIPLKEGELTEWRPHFEKPDIYLSGKIRRVDKCWVVSVFLINDQEDPDKLREEAWLFQAELKLRAPDNSPIFCKRTSAKNGSAAFDPELRTLAMLYRDRVEFAVGHGVAVHATLSPSDTHRATAISTTFIPQHEVAKVETPSLEEIPLLKDLEVDMKELSSLSREQTALKLEPLARAYDSWIADRRSELKSGAQGLSEFKSEAEEALAKCEATLKRLWEGVSVVQNDEQAHAAFQFMNRAMWLQRTRSIFAEEKRRERPRPIGEIDSPSNRSWRPFQLAFVLINIASIRHPNHKHRSDPGQAIADLLFFPTGGGKTEAYLGLTAFTLAIRRLQGDLPGVDGREGVGVLMRYTLRLLTLQQFQRAAALVCAMEQIRRESLASGSKQWGESPFRLGLWVGQKTTPNTVDQAEEVLRGDRRYGGFAAGVGDPLQLAHCPWCGTKIEQNQNVKVDRDLRRVLIYCGDSLGECLFTERQSPGEGIPVLVVDEELYRCPPALLIATVDKFAQMPWKGGVQNLFGIVSSKCTRHGYRYPEDDDADSHQTKGALPKAKTIDCKRLRPPDLIIQDELHLISGPLGSLVGLYETAIDKLCHWSLEGETIRPKIIASTATIRAAGEQVRNIYQRQVGIFPPHGTDIRDNFFAVERAPSAKSPGRVYLGICAKGKTFKGAMKRAYMIALAGPQTLYEKYGQLADPWMTTIGYFNSIRELAGMRRLLDDAVRSMLRRAEDRGLARRLIDPAGRDQELTSARVTASDIPRILDRLEVSWPPKGERKTRQLDFLLATNMISVGVDVRRLGLMVVCGQPKTTAEYIQATSRVGRTFPGVVLTVFNWAKPRDLSHFEHFEHYHSTFYQQVEATSVTPFAPRTIDRGLSALLVSLIRLGSEDFSANEAAAAVSDEQWRIQVNLAIEEIVGRAREIARDPRLVEEVRAKLDDRIDNWRAEGAKARGALRFGYVAKENQFAGLLEKPGVAGWEPFSCLNSLRNVEPSVMLLFDDEGMNQPPGAGNRG